MKSDWAELKNIQTGERGRGSESKKEPGGFRADSEPDLAGVNSQPTLKVNTSKTNQF